MFLNVKKGLVGIEIALTYAVFIVQLCPVYNLTYIVKEGKLHDKTAILCPSFLKNVFYHSFILFFRNNFLFPTSVYYTQ